MQAPSRRELLRRRSALLYWTERLGCSDPLELPPSIREAINKGHGKHVQAAWNAMKTREQVVGRECRVPRAFIAGYLKKLGYAE